MLFLDFRKKYITNAFLIARVLRDNKEKKTRSKSAPKKNVTIYLYAKRNQKQIFHHTLTDSATFGL